MVARTAGLRALGDCVAHDFRKNVGTACLLQRVDLEGNGLITDTYADVTNIHDFFIGEGWSFIILSVDIKSNTVL